MKRNMMIAVLALGLAGSPAARAELTAALAAEATEIAWEAHAALFAADTEAELDARRIEVDGAALDFQALSFENGEGEACEGACAASDWRRRPLFISLHGGGGAPAEVNDEQWNNQLELGHEYAPWEGIYIAPRAPTDEWDCWHGPAVDALLTRLINAFVAAGTADPDRVYLMGYSAGGDGVYQLAPRMADRFAGAAMMAGHPNGVSVENLRNLPFAIHVGEDDDAYDRAAEAAKYGRKLAALRAKDPDGYTHQVRIHAGKGHWMDLEDRVAVPWIARDVRDTWPKRVVWRLGSRHPDSLYWIGLPEGGEDGDLFVASVDGQVVTIDGPVGRAVELRFSDALIDLDAPVSVVSAGGDTLFEGQLERSSDTIVRALAERVDPSAAFSATVTVTLP